MGGLQTVRQMWLAPRESFRKCEHNRVVLGGWSLQNGLDPKLARWFSLAISPSELPMLFRENGESSWASTSAEYLASFAAMAAFGHLDGPKSGVRDCVQVSICGGTDNRSTPAVQKKGLSTKWPLFGFQMCAHSAMNDVNKRLVLNWRPREENSYADELTNGVFSRFSPHLRVRLTLDQIPLGLLRKLAKAADEFAEVKSSLVTLKSSLRFSVNLCRCSSFHFCTQFRADASPQRRLGGYCMLTRTALPLCVMQGASSAEAGDRQSDLTQCTHRMKSLCERDAVSHVTCLSGALHVSYQVVFPKPFNAHGSMRSGSFWFQPLRKGIG